MGTTRHTPSRLLRISTSTIRVHMLGQFTLASQHRWMDPNEKDDTQERPQRSVPRRTVSVDDEERATQADDTEVSYPTSRGAFKSRRRLRSLRRLKFISRLLAESEHESRGS